MIGLILAVWFYGSNPTTGPLTRVVNVEPTCELAAEVLDSIEARTAFLGGELEKTDVVSEKILLSQEIYVLFGLGQGAAKWQIENCE